LRPALFWQSAFRPQTGPASLRLYIYIPIASAFRNIASDQLRGARRGARRCALRDHTGQKPKGETLARFKF
jgi:hypothetical protein